MKYIRLTKEQLEALHNEFARFLAAQQITFEQWSKIKRDKPQVAEEELDIFSDYVWDTILQKVKYLEKADKNILSLFYASEENIQLLLIKTTNKNCNFQTEEGITYLLNNILHDDFQIFKSTKNYSQDKKEDIFNLIKQGAQISEGELYKHLASQMFI